MPHQQQDEIRAGAAELVRRYVELLQQLGFEADVERQWIELIDTAPERKLFTYPSDQHRASPLIDESRAETAGASLSPFEIAELAAAGGVEKLALWLEYVDAMHGTRSAVITAPMAKALGIQAARDEGPKFDDTTRLGLLPSVVWRGLLDQGLQGTFLSRIKMEGAPAWAPVRRWALEVTGYVPSIPKPAPEAQLEELKTADHDRVAEIVAWLGVVHYLPEGPAERPGVFRGRWPYTTLDV